MSDDSTVIVFTDTDTQAHHHSQTFDSFCQGLHKCQHNLTHTVFNTDRQVGIVWQVTAGQLLGFRTTQHSANQIPDYNRIQSLPGRMIGYTDYNLIIAELPVTHG